jgi:hypothetical protein
MAIQPAVAVAFHSHPGIVDTPTFSVPPAAAIVSLARSKLNRHCAPAWLIDTREAPTTIAPVRGAGSGLVLTV